MIIGITLFPYKNIHKGTWKSPERTTVNPVIHKLMRNIVKLPDELSCRGANDDADHYLLVAGLR
jgi:hypothetical protein